MDIYESSHSQKTSHFTFLFTLLKLLKMSSTRDKRDISITHGFIIPYSQHCMLQLLVCQVSPPCITKKIVSITITHHKTSIAITSITVTYHKNNLHHHKHDNHEHHHHEHAEHTNHNMQRLQDKRKSHTYMDKYKFQAKSTKL